MNKTRPRKYNEIKKLIDVENDVISVISCNTCVRLSNTGGEKKLRMLANRLRKDNVNVLDGFLITMPCVDSYLENVKLHHSVNTIVMLTCSCGCANATTHFPDKKIVPALQDRGTEIILDVKTNKKGWRVPKV